MNVLTKAAQLLRESGRWGQLRGLAEEPLVFCQSDLFAENFIFDPQGRVVCIDFSEASIVPSSLAKFSVIVDNARLPIMEWVYLPTTDPSDNTGALHNIRSHLILTSCSLGDLGRSLPLGDDETQARLQRTIRRTVGAETLAIKDDKDIHGGLNKEAEENRTILPTKLSSSPDVGNAPNAAHYATNTSLLTDARSLPQSLSGIVQFTIRYPARTVMALLKSSGFQLSMHR